MRHNVPPSQIDTDWPIDIRRDIMRRTIMKRDLQQIIEVAHFLNMTHVIKALKCIKMERIDSVQLDVLNTVIIKGDSK